MNFCVKNIPGPFGIIGFSLLRRFWCRLRAEQYSTRVWECQMLGVLHVAVYLFRQRV